ncbi:6-phosphogluconolactonase [Cognataquiflexum rubidum]|uniref:6-phosphogluconolactonase n=1 Tax=Cognataquiflexum rubidum TaxID=2922273 RepID=UPI001F1401B6|nr:6-phosphogluconolactonase [Cognataquiflexum rubidum]MCH6234581.1 6-phosphogluconolactonase [Cognataquiflexum rubidum]
MEINVFDSRKEMGEAAAKAVEERILKVLEEKENVRIVFAAAPSQNEFLAALRTSSKIPWEKVTAFHMDEYVGLSKDSPALFSNFLKEKLFDKLPFGKINLIDGNKNPEEECDRYASLLRQAPIDLVCMGIGENGHIAFNDPPVADFNDSKTVKMVALDRVCRQQQINDGCFSALEEVPSHALTLTITALLDTAYICCVVPGKNKRHAVTDTISGPTETQCPASILRIHANCHLFLDIQSYLEILEPNDKNESIGIDCLSGKLCVFNSSGNFITTSVKPSKKQLNDHFFIGPGLVDLQINGVNGIDFNDPKLSVSDIESATHFLLSKGVTTFFPTLITNEDQVIISIFSTFKEACDNNPLIAACIGGIHLEGPFISSEEGAKGAHNSKYIQKPNWDLLSKFQDASGGRIKLITMAPELDNAFSFIKKCCANGIKVAFGHSNAAMEDLEKGIDAGASLSTHLGNAVPLMLQRHPNILWDQLSLDQLHASLIADGFHVPDSFLKVVLKVKGEKAFLVSDATKFCGMPPGEYNTHIGDEVILSPNGKLSLKNGNGLLAGASKTLLEGMEYLIEKKLADLSMAWKMASVIPAAYLGIGFQIPNTNTDLVFFKLRDSGKIKIHKVVKNGEVFKI